jgi:isovaleryl-CoA dehydrogenase
LPRPDRAARRRDRPHQHFPRDLWPELGKLGVHGITVEEDGVEPGSAISSIAWRWRRFRARRRGRASYGAHSNLCVNQIRRHGSEAQKRKYLPDLISGEHVGALAMSEVGAGSDVVA